jgi:hypothetical protein
MWIVELVLLGCQNNRRIPRVDLLFLCFFWLVAGFAAEAELAPFVSVSSRPMVVWLCGWLVYEVVRVLLWLTGPRYTDISHDYAPGSKDLLHSSENQADKYKIQ